MTISTRTSVPEVLLTPQDVACVTRVHVDTLRVWRAARIGPRSITLGGRDLYLRGDVEEWMGAAGIDPRSEPTPATGAVDCAAWCQFGDGHGEARYVEDQACFTAELRVPLSLHPRIPEENYDEATGQWVAASDYVEINGTRHVDQSAEIRCSHAGGPDVRLTLDEARQLVEAVQLLLGQIEVGR